MRQDRDRYTSQLHDLQRHYGQRRPRGGEREWREEYRYGSEPEFDQHERGYSQQDYRRTEGYGSRSYEQEPRPEPPRYPRQQQREQSDYGAPEYTRHYGPGPYDPRNRGQWSQGYGQPGWSQQYSDAYAEPERYYRAEPGRQSQESRNWQEGHRTGAREPIQEPRNRQEHRFGEPGYGERASGGFANTWGMAGGTAAPQQRGLHIGRGPKGYRRSDDRLHEDVCQRLTDHAEIDASEVEIQVRDGEVTLSGKIESRHVKRLAEDVTWDVPGVRDVHNQLRIAGSNR